METQRLPASGRKEKAHTNNVVSIVVATALCAGTLYVLNALPGILNMEAPYNVFTTGLVQVTSFGLLLWMIYVYARSEKTLTRNWLKEESGRDEEYVLRCYEKPCCSSIDLAGILQDVWYPKNFMRHSQSG